MHENFIMSLFQASRYLEHKCSSSGGQNSTGIITPVGGRPVHRWS